MASYGVGVQARMGERSLPRTGRCGMLGSRPGGTQTGCASGLGVLQGRGEEAAGREGAGDLG